MDLQKTVENLKKRGFTVSVYPDKTTAAKAIAAAVQNKSIGVGGSMTIRAMGLLPMLEAGGNRVITFASPLQDRTAILRESAAADVYLTSANGIAETGEIVNIDGTGNRVASNLFGHEKLYIIAGINKIAPDLESAIWRARNIASPLNARRLERKTPCTVGELKCHDCQSPERICRGLTVLMTPMGGIGETEVVLIEEELGY